MDEHGKHQRNVPSELFATCNAQVVNNADAVNK